MTKSTEEKKTESPRAVDLVDDVRESAKAGQHSASEALRRFRRTVDEAIPDNLRRPFGRCRLPSWELPARPPSGQLP